MSTRKLIGILIAATVIAYVSSLGNPFIWDDEQFITQNTYVQQFAVGKMFTTNTVAGAGVQSNYYRPLTSISFALDAKIWGNPPAGGSFGFHLTNLVFHLSAGVVLFFLLTELGLSSLVSFFLSLFFLIHPVQTEAVTYINSRGDSMYSFFLMTSLLIFTKGLRKGIGLLQAVGIVVLFICSLLSKEIALAGVGLYGAIVGLYGMQKKRPVRGVFLVIGALVLVIALYMALRLTLLNFGNTLNFYGGENAYTQSLAVRLFTFCKVLFVYVGILIFPYSLHMERAVGLVKSIWSPWVLGMLALCGGVMWAGVYELKKKRSAWILFGFLWFGIMLVPSSGIIPINGMLYEHWLYLPMVGFFILVYGLIGLLATSSQLLAAFRRILLPVGIIAALVYIMLTIKQNNIWSDPILFYTYTLSFAPTSARLHNNLGMSYANKNDLSHAVSEYKQAIALAPSYPQAHNNLANAYSAESNYDLSEKEYTDALRLDPNFLIAKINLLDMYIKSKQFTKALPLIKELNSSFAGDPRFLFNYGYVLWNLGQKEAAENTFQQALLLSHNDPALLQAIENVTVH